MRSERKTKVRFGFPMANLPYTEPFSSITPVELLGPPRGKVGLSYGKGRSDGGETYRLGQVDCEEQDSGVSFSLAALGTWLFSNIRYSKPFFEYGRRGRHRRAKLRPDSCLPWPTYPNLSVSAP